MYLHTHTHTDIYNNNNTPSVGPAFTGSGEIQL